jgi:hypothetical protein
MDPDYDTRIPFYFDRRVLSRYRASPDIYVRDAPGCPSEGRVVIRFTDGSELRLESWCNAGNFTSRLAEVQLNEFQSDIDATFLPAITKQGASTSTGSTR